MNNNNTKRKNLGGRSRRGVGAIIGGAMLAAILLSAGLAFFMIILKNDQARTGYVIQAQQADKDRGTETFVVDRALTIVGGAVNVTIGNTGSIPMVASHALLYCSEGTLCITPGIPIENVDISTTLNPGESYPLTLGGSMSTNNTYTISVISERGNIVSSTTCTVLADGTCTEDSEGGSGDELPPIDPKLLQQPQIQAIFPNPFGLSSGTTRPLWGAVIANPTDHPMNIRKLVISAHDPSLSSQSVLCNNNLNSVTPASGWACAGQGSTWNVLEWKTFGTPITIAAHNAQLFLAQTGSPTTGSNAARPSISLNYNVYTDFGQFTKVGYDFGVQGNSMGNNNHPMVNVFLSTALADKTPANVVGVINVASGQPVTVRASIANYVPSTTVDLNTALIIDVPADFTAVNVTSSIGFNSPCVPVLFPADGSHQIRCTLPLNALNGAGAGSSVNVRTVQFTMTAPIVDETKLYQLYVLGDGTSENSSFTVGPVSENIIRVIAP